MDAPARSFSGRGIGEHTAHRFIDSPSGRSSAPAAQSEPGHGGHDCLAAQTADRMATRLMTFLRLPREPAMDVTLVAERFQRATAEIGKVLVGQHELVEATLVALFCEGNVLIEGVPGLGKTLLVNVLSRVLSCRFKRVQFTPDLMPSDLTGHSIYNMADHQFSFNAGPIFTNLLLPDELNRPPPTPQPPFPEPRHSPHAP